MTDDRQPDQEVSPGDVDPEDFLRALLRISPEDAAKVREDAARLAAGPHQEAGPAASG
jgi:hypothetical protein